MALLCSALSIPACSPVRHLYENAIFFADKLVTLTGDPDDVYRLAQAYVFTKQFRRALHTLSKNLSQVDAATPRFRYLTAKCLAECQELDECLNLLDDAALRAVGEEAAMSRRSAGSAAEGQVSMLAAMQLLKGSVYESQENCGSALLHSSLRQMRCATRRSIVWSTTTCSQLPSSAVCSTS